MALVDESLVSRLHLYSTWWIASGDSANPDQYYDHHVLEWIMARGFQQLCGLGIGQWCHDGESSITQASIACIVWFLWPRCRDQSRLLLLVLLEHILYDCDDQYLLSLSNMGACPELCEQDISIWDGRLSELAVWQWHFTCWTI